MKEKWTGDLVGKMHINEVTYEELANEVGWNKSYLSMILNGSRNPAGAKEKLQDALSAIIQRRKIERDESA